MPLERPGPWGEKPYICYSFNEVAAEIGCTAKELRSAIEEVPRYVGGRPRSKREIQQETIERPADMTTGFQVIALADYVRLSADGHLKGELSPPDSFRGWIVYEDAAREFDGTGADFIESLRKQRVATPSIKCLTEVGRDYALKYLRSWLTTFTMPDDVKGATAVHDWRERQQSKPEPITAAAIAKADRRRKRETQTPAEDC